MGKIFWLLALIATVLNAYMLRRGARKLITEHPELEEGYEKIFKGYLFFGCLSWIVMGVGVLSGSVHIANQCQDSDRHFSRGGVVGMYLMWSMQAPGR